MYKLIRFIKRLLSNVIIVSNREDFFKMFDSKGYPLEPFIVEEDTVLFGLDNIRSLDNVKFSKGVKLFGLHSIKSLKGITLEEGVELYNLYNVIVKPINPTASEMTLLKQIPLDGLIMSDWHCGTSHCLAGWAQVLN